ncbi:MAG: hypothetical protein J6Y02_22180 [Pseudobutyrivibrio sp.]|nr:hypothetical protein [Pseudobutyrivibrio sp.]
MLKETITYHDLDGNEITEDFYFNLYQSECAELSFSKKGGLADYVKKITEEEDGDKLVALFKEVILKAYGVRGSDGKSFKKSPELAEAFSQTEAYSILFMKMVTDDKEAARFLNGIAPNLPKDNLPAKTTTKKTTK